MEKFTFLNHACFITESEKAILMYDPWFEEMHLTMGGLY